ncbi:hypothetical protein RN001_004753 [Aquatica leii]|uniref:Saposin B-type domain-containing protein n=1 Tax=Aquatica leii TaxID=1421715 RepID=A0AAN7PYW1_9COLE|nr:hypothetical protein RN001_004753 [Aquatica leii]
MFIHICLFILNFIYYTSYQTIDIHAVFGDDEDSIEFDERVSISSAVLFARNRTDTSDPYEDEDNYLMIKDDNHESKETCACVKVVQIINPYKDLVPLKAFNMASMQCAICLSIAKQIQTTLGEYKIGLNDPKEEIAKLRYGIRIFCRSHFSVLQLRNNLKHFENIAKLLKYASNEVQENWRLLLNQKCNKYINHINVISFYNVLLERTSSISSFLCSTNDLITGEEDGATWASDEKEDADYEQIAELSSSDNESD